jgi:hypothetical protein
LTFLRTLFIETFERLYRRPHGLPELRHAEFPFRSQARDDDAVGAATCHRTEHTALARFAREIAALQEALYGAAAGRVDFGSRHREFRRFVNADDQAAARAARCRTRCREVIHKMPLLAPCARVTPA